MAYDACGSASGFGRSAFAFTARANACVSVVDSIETDIRVCQSSKRRHVGRIEPDGARQRLRSRAEALGILMQTPKQRPGFSIGRIDSDGAIEVCGGFAKLPCCNQNSREQFSCGRVIGTFRQQTFESRARLCVVAGLSKLERAASDGIRI